MKHVEVLIVGGGPAGLCAAISAAESGAGVLVAERSAILGGQLIKQTHMFFGSEKQYAGTRGIDITDILISKLEVLDNVEIMKDANILSVYDDGVITIEQRGIYTKIRPERIIVATGASEKSLAFPNNDMPGIYGAGAVQTLMNIHGVKPGHDVLMVGAGNIGLIVSYIMMDFIMIQDWPQNIGGKPSFSYLENMPAFVPIMFELTVFFSAHLMVITFYMRSKIGPFVEATNPDPRTTDDKFLMEVTVSGDENELTDFLKETGAIETKIVENH